HCLYSDRRSYRSLRNRLLGSRLYHFKSLWDLLLGRVAQLRDLECRHRDRIGAGNSSRGSSISRTTKAHVAATSGSGPARGGPSRCRSLRLRQCASTTAHLACSPVSANTFTHLGGPPLRTRRDKRIHGCHYVPGDLGNDAWTRPVPHARPGRKCARPAIVPSRDSPPTHASCRADRGGKRLAVRAARKRGALSQCR